MTAWITSDSRTPRGMSLIGSFASAASAVADSKPTTRRMAMVDWKINSLRPCGLTTLRPFGCA